MRKVKTQIFKNIFKILGDSFLFVSYKKEVKDKNHYKIKKRVNLGKKLSFVQYKNYLKLIYQQTIKNKMRKKSVSPGTTIDKPESATGTPVFDINFPRPPGWKGSMRAGGYILRNDWLKYSEDIAAYSFDKTDNKCVYHQLSAYFLNPPSGRPTKFINKKRMSPEAIHDYLNENRAKVASLYYDNISREYAAHASDLQKRIKFQRDRLAKENEMKPICDEDEPFSTKEFRFIRLMFDEEQKALRIERQHLENQYQEMKKNFPMDAGVTPQMVSLICEEVGRSFYAFNADDKIFITKINNESGRHYSPVIMYCMNEHSYILNTSDSIKSVVERVKHSNSNSCSKLSSDNDDDDQLNIVFIDKFEINSAMELEAGIYVIRKETNISDLTISFIKRYGTVVKTRMSDNSIVSMSYKNAAKQNVSISIDTCHRDCVEFDEMKEAVEANGFVYKLQGFGSLANDIVNKELISSRISLTKTTRKQILDHHHHKCVVCNMKLLNDDDYQIDHILPRAAGGSNEMENLQPLCIECHAEKTSEELESGIYKEDVIDRGDSAFNDAMYQTIVRSGEIKSLQFIEKVIPDSRFDDFRSEQLYNIPAHERKRLASIRAKAAAKGDKMIHSIPIYIGDDRVQKIDMQKCRRNILYYSKFEFPVYNVMDEMDLYDGSEIRCGMYYIETSNIFPFRGSGWYFECIVKYGLENGIISLENIKFQFLPSETLPRDHFQKTIDVLLDKFKTSKDLQKKAVNAYIGLMGSLESVSTSCKFTTSYHDAAKFVAGSKCKYISNNKINETTTLYQVVEHEKKSKQYGTKYLIYCMILQMEALELHKLETLIVKARGTVIDRNTDAIRFETHAMNLIDFSDHFWDDAKLVPKYQDEYPRTLKFESVPRLCRVPVSYKMAERPWNVIDDSVMEAEQLVDHILASQESIHVDGLAGTGKSFLINKLISRLKNDEESFKVLCPTNKAARIVGGVTLHSLKYRFQNAKAKFVSSLQKLKYLIIDEVSMMGSYFYKMCLQIKAMVPQLKFIISGDFGQLPPVLDSWEGDYSESSALWNLCGGNRLLLRKCRRSNRELFDRYNNVEMIRAADFPVTRQTFLNIAYTHETRIRVNQRCQSRFTSLANFTIISKDPQNLHSQDVRLCPGLPLVCFRTAKKYNILNSERFVVKAFDDKFVTLEKHGHEDEEYFEIPLTKFQKHFYLGFCLTVYASQGETFSEPYTIYNWNWSMFSKEAKYVAISRSTCLENIQIN